MLSTAYAAPQTLYVNATAITMATHGQFWNFWLYAQATATAANFSATAMDAIIFVGTKQGRGTLSKSSLSTDKLTYTNIPFSSGQGTVVRLIDAPTGGVGQFKGLTYTSTANGKYIQTVCKGVQPMYNTTWSVKLSTEAGNGFVV